ncbi:MAG: putative lipid II flippase FtsW [Pseudomonadota bacterium]
MSAAGAVPAAVADFAANSLPSFRGLQPATLTLIAALIAIGFIMIHSATNVDGVSSGLATRHAATVALGVGGFLMLTLMPLALWQSLHRIGVLAAVALCLLVLLPGVGITANGAQRWLPFVGVTLQVSEWVKPLLLVYLAGYLARVADAPDGRRFVDLVPPALTLVGVGALLLLQPDFGALVVISAVTIGMLFIAGVRLGYFVLLVLAAGGLLGFLLVAQPYRWERLVSFTDPWSTAFGSGYQLTQALIAFGRGEWFGLGLGQGVQKLFYLPEAHNDFILAVIAEELGVVGVLLVLGLLTLLALRILNVGRRALVAGQRFAGYLCYGTGLLFAVQVLINAGVNTGLLPTKGLTLPLVSYGSNSMLVCMGLLALVARAEIELPDGDAR